VGEEEEGVEGRGRKGKLNFFLLFSLKRKIQRLHFFHVLPPLPLNW
jgi:hypothetical protein